VHAIFFASNSGAVGDAVADLGFPPGKPSGRYQRHIDSILGGGLDRSSLYRYELPCVDRLTAEPITRPYYMLLPHEALAAEITPTLVEELNQRVSQKHLPPCYFSHPVVLDNENNLPVFPLVMYWDSTTFTRADSFLGVMIYNVLTRVRHLVAV